MEPNYFNTDLMKIKYAGQHLKDKAYKWDRSYHLQISQRDAYQVAGIVELDPHYANWVQFENYLQATFGQRLTQEQEVHDWDKLHHINNINEFIDNLVGLMWQSDYHQKVVEDKIRESLNSELSVEWAKVLRKPDEICKQLSMPQEIGLTLEVHKKS